MLVGVASCNIPESKLEAPDILPAAPVPPTSELHPRPPRYPATITLVPDIVGVVSIMDVVREAALGGTAWHGGGGGGGRLEATECTGDD